MRTDTLFWPQVLSLAECLCQEIKASELPEVCFCGVLPGASPPLDYCTACGGDGCGMAWVSMGAVTPLLPETGVSTFTPCTTPMQATVEVGIARCAPMLDDEGNPPSLADQLESAELVAADMAASLRAIRCCDAIGTKDFDIGGWAAFGPEGGCIGGVWQVTLFEAS